MKKNENLFAKYENLTKTDKTIRIAAAVFHPLIQGPLHLSINL
jgi:hypothetical protein